MQVSVYSVLIGLSLRRHKGQAFVTRLKFLCLCRLRGGNDGEQGRGCQGGKINILPLSVLKQLFAVLCFFERISQEATQIYLHDLDYSV